MSSHPSSIGTSKRRVAVIGAGISGVCTAAHLLKDHGDHVEVVVFERSSTAGGVWHFDYHTAPDPAYPNLSPSRGDYVRYGTGNGVRSELEDVLGKKVARAEALYQTPPRTPTPNQQRDVTSAEIGLEAQRKRIAHAPPGPCYVGLQNNVSLQALKTTLGDWPANLPDFVSQRYLEEYIQKIAGTFGVDEIALYNTRVEEVVKDHSSGNWTVSTSTLDDTNALKHRQWTFDAIVVASGHYNMPRIPDLPGLVELKKRYPDRFMHSKGYRTPELFRGKRVLLVGAGVSSMDIAKECAQVADQVYQSSRGGALDLPPTMLPENALRIGGVKRFQAIDGTGEIAAPEPIPGYIELVNGSKLYNIDHVVLATGYVTSYPFLEQYHADDLPPEDANEDVLVTGNGNMVHNLYKDMFYLQDPTLAFVGQSYHVSTFSLFEFQAQVVARVLAGKAELPSRAVMMEHYRQRLADRGTGRDFHSLRGEGQEMAYVADLVSWVNADAVRLGHPPMAGHTETFLVAHLGQREKLKAHGRNLVVGAKGESFDHVVV